MGGILDRTYFLAEMMGVNLLVAQHLEKMWRITFKFVDVIESVEKHVGWLSHFTVQPRLFSSYVVEWAATGGRRPHSQEVESVGNAAPEAQMPSAAPDLWEPGDPDPWSE